MIAYIRGTLAYIEPEESIAVLETGGIGYRILMSGRDLDLLPAAGEELRLYTYLQVREDAFVLFGFFTREDRKLFQQLLSVQVSVRRRPLECFLPFPRTISASRCWRMTRRPLQKRLVSA